jgi:phosphoglycolate phosphatase-like HAD superfamily hydrolase
MGPGSRNSRPPFAERTPAAESRRLILFDIDGTLVSAGRVARDSILRALESAYVWKAGEEHEDRSRYDFSGKTDPQIVRDLVIDRVGAERCESDLPRALDLYLKELERQLEPGSVVAKPGIAALLSRLAAEPFVTLGLMTGNLERGARLKLEPPDFNRYFPFGAFGSDSADRYQLPRIAVSRARERTGHVFEGKAIVVVGDSVHDVGCGRSLGVRSVAVATGITSPERLAAENPDALLADCSDTERALEAILG